MRYPEATWIPSPNFGYPRGTHGQLEAKIDEAGKSGEFWHSQQGRQAVSIRMFQDPALEIAAHFLYPKVGKPVQMVDSNDPAWHAGGFIANVYYHGFEFEGGPPGNLSEPLTANQIAWGVRVTHWLRQVHKTPTRYVRKDTLWEHNEVKATACPSGRIPWTKVIAALGATVEEDDMPVFFRNTKGAISVATAQGKRHVGATEWSAWRKAGATHTNVTDTQYNAVPNLRQPLTATQTQTEVKRAINASGGKFRQWCREAIVSTGINIVNVHKRIEAAIAGVQTGSGLTKQETVDAVKKANREGTS